MLDSNGNPSSAFTDTLRPAGEIACSLSTNMGTGWLLCDGSTISRTTYANLFTAIGTRYGAGDGTTTFALPDLRGRSPIGAGMGASLTNRNVTDKYVGEENHTQTVGEMPAHTHQFDTTDGAQVLVEVTANKIAEINKGGALDYSHAKAPQNTGGGAAFNVIHPCFIAYYFVKT